MLSDSNMFNYFYETSTEVYYLCIHDAIITGISNLMNGVCRTVSILSLLCDQYHVF